jgi:hypothetical protein
VPIVWFDSVGDPLVELGLTGKRRQAIQKGDSAALQAHVGFVDFLRMDNSRENQPPDDRPQDEEEAQQ